MLYEVITIHLPVGFTDLNWLVEKINEINSTVFVIHNTLNTFSDVIISTLTKVCKEKILIFSVEDSSIYLNLPAYISNVAVFVYTDYVFGIPVDAPNKISNFAIKDQIIKAKSDTVGRITSYNVCYTKLLRCVINSHHNIYLLLKNSCLILRFLV